MAKTATKATARPAQKAAPKTEEKRPAQTAQRSPAPAQANREPPAGQRTAAPPPPNPQRAATASVPAPRRPQQNAVIDPETLNHLPAHMRGDVDMGKESIDQSDMDIPRLKLIQGLSKELQLYDDLRPGHFFHTASETIFDEAFRVVPVFMDKQYILWRPLEDGGGILARSPDAIHWQPSEGEFEVKLDRKDGGNKVTWKLKPTVAESGLANWGTMNPENPNSPPAATLMYNFLLAFPDYPDLMPAVLTFQRSSVKIARKFNTKLKTVRTPLFGTIFTLSAYDDHNSANQDFKNINIAGSGLIEDPDLYNMYKSLHQSLAGKGLNIRDVDSLQGEGEGGGEEQDSDKPAF